MPIMYKTNDWKGLLVGVLLATLVAAVSIYYNSRDTSSLPQPTPHQVVIYGERNNVDR